MVRKGKSIKRRTKKTATVKVDPEDLFYNQIKESGLPEPNRQFKFHPKRRWRADFGWNCEYNGRKVRLIAEVEGGIFIGGRHTHPIGFTKDVEKYDEAEILGYKVIRVTSGMVRDGRGLDFLKRAFDSVY